MAYARFGYLGSDVYVYKDLEGIYHCYRAEESPIYTRHPEEMLNHLLDHREQGDNVPTSAIERLRKEIKEKHSKEE